MTRRTTRIATLLAASLATAALAHPAHHLPGEPASSSAFPPEMGGGMVPGNASTMRTMHSGMMRHMHEMMAQVHGTPSGQTLGMVHGGAGTPGLESLSGAEFETAFMSMMITHHQGAIAMADWVLERGDEPAVLAAARAIKAAQEPEIEQMTTWLRQWYDADVDAASAAGMNADMRGMMAAMAQGADPDTAFLAEMIRHHQGAIDMAQLALERAEHEELRDLARDIILAQADEVHQYQSWLDQVAQ